MKFSEEPFEVAIWEAEGRWYGEADLVYRKTAALLGHLIFDDKLPLRTSALTTEQHVRTSLAAQIKKWREGERVAEVLRGARQNAQTEIWE